MKFVLFTVALVLGVPTVAAASAFSKQLKRLAFVAMIVSFLFGSQFSINLMSMEMYRGPVRGFEVTLADIIVLGLILGMMLRTGSLIIWRPRMFFPLFAFFIFSIINVYQSEYTIYGWFVVWQLFRMGLLYWCVINFFATEEYDHGSIGALMLGYTISGLIMALITFKQKYLDGLYRTQVFFDHSNTVPSYALIFMFVLFVWVLYNTKSNLMQHLIELVAALGIVFAVLSTSSRTGMVMAGASVVGALVVANRKTRNTRIRFTTIFLIICMLIGLAMVIDTVIYRFLNAPESSEEARNEFEIAAIMMADDHSIGVGLNQYSQVLTLNKTYREHIKVMKYEEQAGVAHHIYLLTAAEMGYFGMYFFIAIIALFILSMLYYGLPWKTLEQRLLLGVSGGLVILFAIGFYEWVIRLSPVLYQLVVAAAFGQSLITMSKKNKGLRKRSPKGNES
jgi:hypothetical protein